VEIELGVIAAAAGSARVKLGGTDVVVAVKVKANQKRVSSALQASVLTAALVLTAGRSGASSKWTAQLWEAGCNCGVLSLCIARV
jgi:ribonuclease PH